MKQYFSDRELGQKPRISEDITQRLWEAIWGHISSEMDNGAFGLDFPLLCPDGEGVAGNDVSRMSMVLKGEIPDIEWPLSESPIPAKFMILDLIEFCHAHVAETIQGGYHSFFRHYHLSFDRESGQKKFRDKINLLFSRNGIAFDLDENGKIVRLSNPIFQETLGQVKFDTGDRTLDNLLIDAQTKFLSPDPNVRQDAIEKLWDAWERIKTIEPGKDKKEKADKILDKAASECKFRDLLGREANELNSIGNKFRIRHSETDQTEIQKSHQIDYLFHRMFAMIYLLLESR